MTNLGYITLFVLLGGKQLTWERYSEQGHEEPLTKWDIYRDKKIHETHAIKCVKGHVETVQIDKTKTNGFKKKKLQSESS